jgi:hypothetical protein
MKRPELLGVMLKTIGFWSLIGGISGLPQAISFSHQYPDEQAFMLMMADTFAGPSILIVASWFLIRATNWIVGLAYCGNNLTANEESSESSRELFGVVLIALGYWEILNGVVRLPYEFARTYRASLRSFDGIAYSGIVIVAGCFLVFASDWCVQFAYRKSAQASDGETEVVGPEN